MKSSEIWILVATVVSFCGAIFCFACLFMKQVNYMRKADRPVPQFTTNFTEQPTRHTRKSEAALTA